MTRSCFLVLLLTLSTVVSAQGNGFDYNYLEASYHRADFDSLNADGDGFGLGGSIALSKNFHLFGSYAGQDIDSSADADGWNIGLGLNKSLTSLMDLLVQVSYQTTEVNSPVVGRTDNDGFGLRAGVRVGANEWIEVFGGLSYYDLDSGNETALDGGFLLNISQAFSIGVSGRWDDDVSVLSLNGRLYFGSR